jgi:hypothetical protein
MLSWPPWFFGWNGHYRSALCEHALYTATSQQGIERNNFRIHATKPSMSAKPSDGCGSNNQNIGYQCLFSGREHRHLVSSVMYFHLATKCKFLPPWNWDHVTFFACEKCMHVRPFLSRQNTHLHHVFKELFGLDSRFSCSRCLWNVQI